MDVLARQYETIRAHTEALAAPLTAEDQCIQSMPDASPVKWHRAHVTWFFEEFVLRPSGEITGCSTTIFGSCSTPIMKPSAPGIRGLCAAC